MSSFSYCKWSVRESKRSGSECPRVVSEPRLTESRRKAENFRLFSAVVRAIPVQVSPGASGCFFLFAASRYKAVGVNARTASAVSPCIFVCNMIK